MLSHLPGYSLPERLWRTARRWALGLGVVQALWLARLALPPAWLYLSFAVMLVLVLSPSSYTRAARRTLARHIYLDTAPILMGFTVLAALLALVITRIVVVTALSYGLSRYALEMVIRVLVLELIPLTATLFVAMRCTIPHGTQLALLRQSGHFDALRAQGGDPVRMELLPRVVAGVFASITLAALSCVVALIMAYISVYGFNLAGLPSYTRMFGHVFSPAVTLVFALKTLFSSLAVALIPTTAGMYDAGEGVTPDSELGGLARMFAVLLLIEVGSLVGNYY